MKLATKISLTTHLLIIVPVIIISTVAFSFIYQTIKSNTVDHIISTNNLKTNQVQSWISLNARRLEEMALSPSLRAYTKTLVSHDSGDAVYSEAWQKIISEYFSPRLWYGSFSEIFMLDIRNGTVLVSTNLEHIGHIESGQTYFTEGKLRTSIQGIYYSEELGKPAMTIATPVRDEQLETTGVIAGHLGLMELSDTLSLQSGLKLTEDTYLVNREGYFVTNPRFGRDYAMIRSVSTEGVDWDWPAVPGWLLTVIIREYPLSEPTAGCRCTAWSSLLRFM